MMGVSLVCSRLVGSEVGDEFDPGLTRVGNTNGEIGLSFWVGLGCNGLGGIMLDQGVCWVEWVVWFWFQINKRVRLINM